MNRQFQAHPQQEPDPHPAYTVVVGIFIALIAWAFLVVVLSAALTG